MKVDNSLETINTTLTNISGQLNGKMTEHDFRSFLEVLRARNPDMDIPDYPL